MVVFSMISTESFSLYLAKPTVAEQLKCIFGGIGNIAKFHFLREAKRSCPSYKAGKIIVRCIGGDLSDHIERLIESKRFRLTLPSGLGYPPFREALIKKVNELYANASADLLKNCLDEKWTVEFQIADTPRRGGEFDIPFFSKLTLRDETRDIEAMLFDVSVRFIHLSGAK